MVMVAIQIIGMAVTIGYGIGSVDHLEALEETDWVETGFDFFYETAFFGGYLLNSLSVFLLILSVLSFSLDLHGKTMGYISKLNREGRGIKKRWDLGEVIDYESNEHKRAWKLVNALQTLHSWTSGAFFMPIVRCVFGLLLADWHTTTTTHNVAYILLCVFLFLFVLASFCLSMTDNNSSQLPMLNVNDFNVFSILKKRLTNWEMVRGDFRGVLTIDPVSGGLLGLVEAVEQLLLT
eukprot:3921887-Ditylum_brightwellii.AAC.1